MCIITIGDLQEIIRSYDHTIQFMDDVQEKNSLLLFLLKCLRIQVKDTNNYTTFDALNHKGDIHT